MKSIKHVSARFSAWQDFTLATVVFFLLVSISFGVAVFSWQSLRSKPYAAFEKDTAVVQALIESRIQLYFNVLRGLQGLFAASKSVERDEFIAYIKKVNLANFPGIIDVRYIEYVPVKNKKAFVESVRGDKSIESGGYSAFQIHPEKEKSDYFPIKYIEPYTGSERLLGLDISEIPERWQAYERARDTGLLSGTSRLIHFPGEDIKRPDFLFVAPIYRNHTPINTVEERRAAIAGFVSAGFHIDKLLSGILSGFNQKGLRGLIVFEGEKLKADQILFNSEKEFVFDKFISDDFFSKKSLIEVGGRKWGLLFFSSVGLSRTLLESYLPVSVFLTGVVVSFLIAWLIYFMRTAQYRAEKIANQMTADLSASVSRFNLVMEATNEGLWEWDTREKVLYSVRFKALIGYSEQELADNISEFSLRLHPDDNEKVFSSLEKHLKQKVPYDVEYQLKHKNGNYIWFQARGQAEWDPKTGVATRMVGSILDISKRKKNELKLSQLASIVESSDDAIIGKNLQGIIQSWNKGAEKIYGYTAAEVIGQSIKIIVPPDRQEEVNKIIRNVIEKKGVAHYETKRIGKNKKIIDISLSTSPILDAQGELSGISAIARNITNEKQLEQQLRQSQKMDAIGKLAGGIAHDFNNLLTVINGYAEMSIKGLANEHPTRSKIEEILKAGRRATELTSQLLNFSRQQIIVPKVVDMSALIQGSTKMLTRLLPANVELSVRCSEDLKKILIDPTQFDQLVMNLVINAGDAMPNGGKLLVEALNIALDNDYVRGHAHVKAGDYVMLAVTDTGSGMTSEIKNRIFEPFFTTKPQGKGTGLGLATCYGIVKQNMGSIEVYSEIGHGTCFKVFSPVSTQAVEQPFRKEMEVNLRGNETILLVEDEEAVRNLAGDVLEKNGYKVLRSENGQKALEANSNYLQEIQLLLTDVVMPVMGGKDLYEKMKCLRPDIKVIYMSGYTQEVILLSEIQSSSVNFIQKPFTVNGLLEKVRQVLNTK